MSRRPTTPPSVEIESDDAAVSTEIESVDEEREADAVAAEVGAQAPADVDEERAEG